MTIKEFAEMVEEQQRWRYCCQFPPEECKTGLDGHEELVKLSCETQVIPGRKYTKVDVGRSGKFMIDEEGNIFGIKGYGKVHRGHYYGTLETTDEWDWGDYYPRRKR